ncbi:sugar porter family MFS transporter [Sphingobacterium alkalisoli]|uniref:Sugar porter family MFS transporter n=1 Tax=Sphingobacterium alkalisoli TaxID=1874115 RepID=A0A4U0H9F6_9SPHI|nr:sugar porter family MFS transporter [Sphingobacterium alkalisoli]TJY68426.1 sugar porter family MFS transporter [Sphingobacterium alkalisoli]
MSESKNSKKGFLYIITFISAMGGLLFGYDWVVIGGAKPFYEVYFEIVDSPNMQGWVMGSAILGCLLGVLITGFLADKFGRKSLLFISALIFIISAYGTGAVEDLTLFIIFRVIGGVGIGIASNLSPMYIAEVAPATIRGKLVSVNQLTIVIGILLAQVVNYLIAEPVGQGEQLIDTWNGQTGWRWMFWSEGFPAILFFVLLFALPESPKWLMSRGRMEDAVKTLVKIGGEEYAKTEIQALHQVNHTAQAATNYGALFKGKMPRILLIGIVIAAFQQWCGINVIFNYAEEIFSAAGYGVSDILFNIIITGITNLVFTIIGMYTVDKLGRRALLIFGSIGLASIYTLLGLCYYYELSGLAVLVLVMLAIGCYAMTLAPITWVVISEIFPTKIRGAAMAISTFSLWTACFILTYTFPILNSSLGAYGTFWLYGVICLLGFVFIKRNLPETKGKTLEEIENELTK